MSNHPFCLFFLSNVQLLLPLTIANIRKVNLDKCKNGLLPTHLWWKWNVESSRLVRHTVTRPNPSPLPFKTHSALLFFLLFWKNISLLTFFYCSPFTCYVSIREAPAHAFSLYPSLPPDLSVRLRSLGLKSYCEKVLQCGQPKCLRGRPHSKQENLIRGNETIWMKLVHIRTYQHPDKCLIYRVTAHMILHLYLKL